MLGAGAEDVGGDGPDLHDPAGPVRAAGGLELVPPGQIERRSRSISRPERLAGAHDHQPVLGRAQRADAHQPHGELDRASRSTSPPPILVPLGQDFGLPVWAIFLVLYPPLSLLFLGITYLVFRWRWWKAGDSG